MKVNFGISVEKRGETAGLIRQVHGTRTVLLTSPPLETTVEDADGVVTDRADLKLHVVTADCMPVLIYDPKSGRSAAIHAGWRGARDGILSKALSDFFPDRSTLQIAIGPCLLVCCFEVKDDFIQSFEERNRPVRPYLSSLGSKQHFDLFAFVKEVELAGCPIDAIDTSLMRCTFCSSPPLPSYRRNGNTDVRILTWIEQTGIDAINRG